MLVDNENNIIRAGRGTPMLSKRSPDGALLWQSDNYGAGTAALDAEGNIGFASFGNILYKIRPDGGSLWSLDLAQGTLDSVVDIAFDRDGHLYVAGTAGPIGDGNVADLGGLVSDLAVTAAGDLIAVGTRFGNEEAVGAWAAKFDGVDGTRRRPVRVSPGGTQQYGMAVAVDRNGDVLLAGGKSGGEADGWLRKYDGAHFDQPDG